MTLRLKLTVSMLFAGLFTAIVVGMTAWWLVMQDFQQKVEDKAFINFAKDMAAYISEYGSYEAAQSVEPFPVFVFRHHRPNFQSSSGPQTSTSTSGEIPNQRPQFGPQNNGFMPPPDVNPDFQSSPGPQTDIAPSNEMPIQRPQFGPQNNGFMPPPGANPDFQPQGRPGGPGQSSSGIHRHSAPFHFLLLNPEGKVLSPVGEYRLGQIVSDDIKDQAKKIVVNGQLALLAVPIGAPILSPQDQIYLNSLKRALVIGMIAAALVSVLLGVFIGSRLVTRLKELMTGLKGMRPDGEIPDPIKIHTRDEIGQLAETFNHMSQLLMQAHQELRELSLRDPLTGLYNRRYFDEQAHNMFQHALRYQSPLCVMLADLDHFKLINDSFSHAVGDAVLQRAAEIFQSNIRVSDLIARYGGEEFIAVFAETDLSQARQRCEQLRKRIESAPWHEIAPGLKVTISIGLCDGVHLGSLEDMVDMADEQLYVAKRNGRNRIEPVTG